MSEEQREGSWRLVCVFRSNLYFGIKHRSPRSLSGGLMWFDYGKLQQSQDRFLR